MLRDGRINEALIIILRRVGLPRAFRKGMINQLLLVGALHLLRVLRYRRVNTSELSILLVSIRVLPTELALDRHPATRQGRNGTG